MVDGLDAFCPTYLKLMPKAQAHDLPALPTASFGDLGSLWVAPEPTYDVA